MLRGVLSRRTGINVAFKLGIRNRPAQCPISRTYSLKQIKDLQSFPSSDGPVTIRPELKNVGMLGQQEGGGEKVQQLSKQLEQLKRKGDLTEILQRYRQFKATYPDLKMDLKTYNVIFDAFVTIRPAGTRLDALMDIYRDLRGERIPLQSFTYKCLLDALFERDNEARRQLHSLELILENPDAYEQGSKRRIDQLQKRLASIKEEGNFHLAYTVYQEACSRIADGIILPIFYQNRVLHMASENGDIDAALTIFENIRKIWGIQPDPYSYAYLIKAFGKVGDMEAARECFDAFLKVDKWSIDNIPRHNSDVSLRRSFIQCWNNLSSAYIENGDVETGRMILEEEMPRAGFKPDIISFNIVIMAKCKNQDLNGAWEVAQRLESCNDGSLPAPNPYTWGGLLSQSLLMNDILSVERAYSKSSKFPDTNMQYTFILRILRLSLEAGNTDFFMRVLQDFPKHRFTVDTRVCNIMEDFFATNEESLTDSKILQMINTFIKIESISLQNVPPRVRGDAWIDMIMRAFEAFPDNLIYQFKLLRVLLDNRKVVGKLGCLAVIDNLRANPDKPTDDLLKEYNKIWGKKEWELLLKVRSGFPDSNLEKDFEFLLSFAKRLNIEVEPSWWNSVLRKVESFGGGEWRGKTAALTEQMKRYLNFTIPSGRTRDELTEELIASRKAEDFIKAAEVMIEMLQAKEPLVNKMTFLLARLGHLGKVAEIKQMLELTEAYPESDLKKSIRRSGEMALLTAYGFQRDFDSVRELCEKLRAKGEILEEDRYAVAAVMRAEEDPEVAIKIGMNHIRQYSPRNDPVIPTFTANVLLGLVVDHRSFAEANALFGLLRSNCGLRPNSVTYSIIMKSAIRAGDIESAEKLFKKYETSKSSESSISGYNLMMQHYALTGQRERVMEIMQMIAAKGVKPTNYSYQLYLYALALLPPRDLSRAKEILEKVMPAAGLEPRGEHYLTFVAGMISETYPQSEIEASLAEVKKLQSSRDVTLMLKELSQVSKAGNASISEETLEQWKQSLSSS